MIDIGDLLAELVRLRKGPGVQRGRQLRAYVGPILSAVCRIRPGDDNVTVRGKLTDGLSSYIRRLPDGIQFAAQAAFAMCDGLPRSSNLLDRVIWLKPRLAPPGVEFEQRTVRRKIDEATRALAEVIAAADHGPPLVLVNAEQLERVAAGESVIVGGANPHAVRLRLEAEPKDN